MLSEVVHAFCPRHFVHLLIRQLKRKKFGMLLIDGTSFQLETDCNSYFTFVRVINNFNLKFCIFRRFYATNFIIIITVFSVLSSNHLFL